MLVKLTILLLLAAGVAQLASPANSAPPANYITAKSGTIARAYWKQRGRDVCRPLRVVSRSATYIALMTGYGDALGFARYGPFRDGSSKCVVVLNRGYNWKRLARLNYGVSRAQLVCATIVHEVGHLSGIKHRRKGIMTPRLSVIPPRCKKGFVSLTIPMISYKV